MGKDCEIFQHIERFAFRNCASCQNGLPNDDAMRGCERVKIEIQDEKRIERKKANILPKCEKKL